MKSVREILESALKIEPLAEVHGTQLVTFEEYQEANYADALNKNDTGIRKLNPDGSIARSKTKYAAVSEDVYYDNRFKIIEEDSKKKYVIVVPQTSDDAYLSVKALNNGKMPPKKRVPAYVISRGKYNALVCEKRVTVSDDDFIANFNHKLDKESMKKVLPCLKADVVTAETLSI